MAQKNVQYSRQIWRSLLPTIIITAVLPYIIYRLASPHMPDVPALLLTGVPPVAYTTIDFICHRRVNLLGMFSLLAIVIKLIAALLFKDIRLVLISDSLMTGVYGVIMIISLLFGKPVLLVLARNMLASAPADQREQIEERWNAAGHSFFTIMTAIWGVGLCIALVFSVILAYVLTVPRFLVINPIIQYSMFGVLILGTQLFGIIRRQRKSGSQEQSRQEPPKKFRISV